MDRLKENIFLVAIGSLVLLEILAPFLYQLPWSRHFTLLSWTAMVRLADLLILFALFRAWSVPFGEMGLRRFFKGTVVGLVASLVLGAGFFLLVALARSFWGLDMGVFLETGIRERGVATLSILCLLGPLLEEIFFRGLCYTLIRSFCYRLVTPHWGVFISVASTALIFGIIHIYLSNANPLVPFIGGVAFAMLYEWTGSLLAPFVLHAVGNFILFSGVL